MRADRKTRQAWRRAESDEDDAAKQVFSGLKRREMSDLETCRRVWEQELDPLAVCEAVRQSNLPDWLTSALLVLLTDGQYVADRPLRNRMWAERRKHATDGARAGNVAMLRTLPEHPQTWRIAFELGEHLSRMNSNVAAVSAAGAKKSYERVRQSLEEYPYRYHRARPGMGARIDEAWAYMLALMKEHMSTPKKAAK